MSEKIEIRMNSPTSSFKSRLIDAFMGNPANIKIQFLRLENEEEQFDEFFEPTISVEGGKLKVYASYTPPINVTVKSIGLCDFQGIYLFYTAVNLPLSAGVTYDFTIWVDVNVTPSTNMTFFMRNLKTILFDVMKGTRIVSDLKISKIGFVVFIIPENQMGVVPVSATVTKLSSTQAKVEGQLSVSGGVYSLCGFKLQNPGGLDFYEYSLSSCVELPTSTITYSETITIQ